MHPESYDATYVVSRRSGSWWGGQAGVPSRDFGEWVQPSLLAMTQVARRFAPSAEVDDVVQESLLRAWRKWDQFDPARGSSTAWLIAITVDQARGARVRGGRRRRVIDDAAAVPDRTGSGPPGADDLDLRRAMALLSVRQRTAVELHYFVGLSVAETAVAMGCTAGTVKSTLFAARKRMSTVLGDGDA